MDEEKLIAGLSALGQRHRLRLFLKVAEAGVDGVSPSTLCDLLEMSPSLVGAHLGKLVAAGLLRREEYGKRALFSVDQDGVRRLARSIEAVLGA